MRFGASREKSELCDQDDVPQVLDCADSPAALLLRTQKEAMSNDIASFEVHTDVSVNKPDAGGLLANFAWVVAND